MNIFDQTILISLNSLSRRSAAFDELTSCVCINILFIGGVLVAALWWLWFRRGPSTARDRGHVLATMLSCFAATGLARVLALTLPFRVRPSHEPSLGFVLPHGTTPGVLHGWSSFPSDHAVAFFALSAGLMFISTRIGVAALAYTAVVIMLPRLYMGLHYPTDIIAGAVIGAFIGWAGNACLVRSGFAQKALRWAEAKPGLFCALFFLASYQLAELLVSTRNVFTTVLKVFRA